MELIMIVAVIIFLLWFFRLLGGLRQEAEAWGDRALKQSQDLRLKAAESRLENMKKNKEILDEDIEALARYTEYREKIEALDL